MPKPFKIAFILYPRVTQLDFTGPYEVLARMPGAEIVVASQQGGALISEMGLTFAGTVKLAEIATCDMIFLPGGPGQTQAMLDVGFMAEVKRLGESARYIASACTGSLILAAAGLLAGKRAASHWAYRGMLAAFGVTPDVGRVVRDGNVFTGGGVTAGIDVALTIVAEIVSPDAAKMIQLSIEYAPAPPFNAGRPETAEPHIVDAVKARFAQFALEREQAIAGLTGRA